MKRIVALATVIGIAGIVALLFAPWSSPRDLESEVANASAVSRENTPKHLFGERGLLRNSPHALSGSFIVNPVEWLGALLVPITYTVSQDGELHTSAQLCDNKIMLAGVPDEALVVFGDDRHWQKSVQAMARLRESQSTIHIQSVRTFRFLFFDNTNNLLSEKIEVAVRSRSIFEGDWMETGWGNFMSEVASEWSLGGLPESELEYQFRFRCQGYMPFISQWEQRPSVNQTRAIDVQLSRVGSGLVSGTIFDANQQPMPSVRYCLLKRQGVRSRALTRQEGEVLLPLPQDPFLSTVSEIQFQQASPEGYYEANIESPGYFDLLVAPRFESPIAADVGELISSSQIKKDIYLGHSAQLNIEIRLIPSANPSDYYLSLESDALSDLYSLDKMALGDDGQYLRTISKLIPGDYSLELRQKVYRKDLLSTGSTILLDSQSLVLQQAATGFARIDLLGESYGRSFHGQIYAPDCSSEMNWSIIILNATTGTLVRTGLPNEELYAFEAGLPSDALEVLVIGYEPQAGELCLIRHSLPEGNHDVDEPKLAPFPTRVKVQSYPAAGDFRYLEFMMGKDFVLQDWFDNHPFPRAMQPSRLRIFGLPFGQYALWSENDWYCDFELTPSNSQIVTAMGVN